MALEYTFFISSISHDQINELNKLLCKKATCEVVDNVVHVDRNKRDGYAVYSFSKRDHFDSEEGSFEYQYILDFDLNKEADFADSISCVCQMLNRIMSITAADSILVFNGEQVLLEYLEGSIRLHNSEFWSFIEYQEIFSPDTDMS